VRRTDAWGHTLRDPLRRAIAGTATLPWNDLAELELGLYLLQCVAPDEPAESLSGLLTGYLPPMRDGDGWTEERRRQVSIARHLLLHFKSLPAWRRALEAYAGAPQRVRGYELAREIGDSGRVHHAFTRRDVSVAPNRWDIYGRALRARLPWRTDSIPPAEAGRYLAITGRSRSTVRVPADLGASGYPAGHDLLSAPATRPPLDVSWDELCGTARWMDQREGELNVRDRGNWEERLSRIRLEVFDAGSGDFAPSRRFRVERLLHLAGMVSSGKSTLMDVLAVWCQRNGKRVTLVMTDVVSAVRRPTYFRRLLGDDAAVPILGRSNRRRHTERLHRVLLGETRASPLQHRDPAFDFLSTACALDGLRPPATKPFEAGTHPCDTLYVSADEDELDSGEDALDHEDGAQTELTTSRRRGCPLYGVCQQQRAPRGLVTAMIWVATPASLVYTRVPTQINREHLRYAELVYRLSDLVIVDEADVVQVQLDSIFSPHETLLGGHRESWFEDLGEQVQRHMRRNARAPLRESGVPHWIAAFDTAQTTGDKLYALLTNEPPLRTWIERDFFAEWTLFHRLARSWAGVPEGSDPMESPSFRRMATDFDQFLANRLPPDDDDRPPDENRTPDDDRAPDSAVETRVRVHPLADIASRLLYEDDLLVTREHVRVWLQGQQREHPDLRIGDLDVAALRMQFVLLLSILAGRLNYILRHWKQVEGPLGLEGGALLFHKPPEEYGPVIPEAPMGNQLGFQYRHPGDGADGAMGPIRFFRNMGVGRWLLLHFHELFAFDGVAGPNVLLLSGTSWAGTSPKYHVQVPVGAILRSPAHEVEAIRTSTFSFNVLLDERDEPITVSGRRGDDRRRAIQAMLGRLASPSGLRGGPSRFEQELAHLPAGRQRILLLVGSYQEARDAHQDLARMRPDWERDQVLHLVPDDDGEDFGHGWAGLRRGEVERFADTGASYLIAPLLAVERGHNILNDEDAAALGSVYFLVRPHLHPDDIGFAIHSINRWAVAHGAWTHEPADVRSKTLDERARWFRSQANRHWRRMLGMPLVFRSMREDDQRAVTWSHLVSIWQVVGRLVRGGHPARVHFCDARFAERTAHQEEGETAANSLIFAMREQLAPFFEPGGDLNGCTEHDRAVVRLLYEPLFHALEHMEGVPRS
jgi:hypothetical protein